MSNNRAMLEVINNSANWGISVNDYCQYLLEKDRETMSMSRLKDHGERRELFFKAIRTAMGKKTICPTATRIYMVLITRPWSDLCILPSCETKGMFSYSRSLEDGDDRRIRAKLGRILRRQCGLEEWFIKDHEMSALTESIVGEMWPDSTGVMQLWGDDIIEFYRTYHPDAPCCMKGRYSRFVQLYAQNRDVVSLLCVSSEGHGVAKALVWELPDGRRVLDRVYHYRHNYTAGQAIIAKARSLGCEIQDNTDCRVHSHNIEMDVVVDMSKCDHLPYVDSVRYVKEIDGLSKVHLSNDDTDNITELTEQDGSMIDSTGTLEDVSFCDCCGDRIDEDDRCCWDGLSYCSECFNQRFFCCDRCSQTIEQDDHHSVDVHGSTESWCQECANNHAFLCEECDDYFSTDTKSHNVVSGCTICIDCLENGSFSCCNDCEEWTDDSNATIVGGDSYCADCVTKCRECGEVFANVNNEVKDGICEHCACIEA